MADQPRKVLLIHASLGSGHKRAAQALYEVLQERHVEAEVQDLLSFLPGHLPTIYPRCYNYMINDCRWLWKFLYHALDKPSRPYAPGKSIFQRWQFQKLRNYLKERQFTHIFSTHFASSALLTDWWQEKPSDTKIFSVVTDHIAHRCWKRTGLHHYFVPSQTVAQQLCSAGIPNERITVSGIPISRAFRNGARREETRSEWVSDEKRLILVLCSGWNLKKTIRVLAELQGINDDSRFLISTGPEPVKEQKIKKYFERQSNFSIFGFSTRIADMMSAADLMISKPGGLIVSEGLAMGLPQILLSPIPGQEEANARYAEDNGAATCIPEKKGALSKTLKELLSAPDKLRAMHQAAKSAGRPDAATTIIEKGLPEVAISTASFVS